MPEEGKKLKVDTNCQYKRQIVNYDTFFSLGLKLRWGSAVLGRERMRGRDPTRLPRWLRGGVGRGECRYGDIDSCSIRDN